MRIHTLLTAIALTASLLAAAQEVRRDSVQIFFPQGKAEFDPFFEGNGQRLLEFINEAKRVQRAPEQGLVRLMVIACASPEGTREINERLADTIERENAALEESVRQMPRLKKFFYMHKSHHAHHFHPNFFVLFLLLYIFLSIHFFR